MNLTRREIFLYKLAVLDQHFVLLKRPEFPPQTFVYLRKRDKAFYDTKIYIRE